MALALPWGAALTYADLEGMATTATATYDYLGAQREPEGSRSGARPMGLGPMNTYR